MLNPRVAQGHPTYLLRLVVLRLLLLLQYCQRLTVVRLPWWRWWWWRWALLVWVVAVVIHGGKFWAKIGTWDTHRT